MPALNTFIERNVEDTTRNVTLVIMGDFARSLPGSDHQPNGNATVIGRNVKQGTTGRTVNGTVRLESNKKVADLWSYIAALTKKGKNPFDANGHPSLLL